MTIPVTKPEIDALINQRLQTGGYAAPIELVFLDPETRIELPGSAFGLRKGYNREKTAMSQ